MNSLYPLTMLYDAACPVCALEMDHLRERDGGRRLRFVDISAPGFDAVPWGTTVAALQAEIHAVRPDGSHLVGLAALRAAYAAAGLGAGWRPRPGRCCGRWTTPATGCSHATGAASRERRRR